MMFVMGMMSSRMMVIMVVIMVVIMIMEIVMCYIRFLAGISSGERGKGVAGEDQSEEGGREGGEEDISVRR